MCKRLIPYGENDPSPTKTFMIEHWNEEAFAKKVALAFGLRPAEELYDLRRDPGQVRNVAGNSDYVGVQARLRTQLLDHLSATRDPRIVGGEIEWDYYPHYGIRQNKNWSVDKRP